MKRVTNVMSEKAKKAKVRNAKVGRSVASVIGGGILGREYVVKQIPFLIYITFLALVYIANNYAAEKLIIKIDSIKKENQVHRFEHISMKSKLMSMSRRSEVVKLLQGTEIKESLVPPQKIYLNSPAN
ncbi:MAG: FtsL-like putative cell division protein [Bacteroidales bacterium]|nr:FtsL-like putative cell division protein [Bacteroidales bacterium]MDZ4204625.1 FtsL-like putative cell division protein [Bacteroidales bacterium]